MLNENQTPQALPVKSKRRIFPWFIIVLLLILGFLYGPEIFKTGMKIKSLEPKPKYFLLKKIIQFTGTKTQGKPMFANDIVIVGPDSLAITDNLGNQVLVYDFEGNLIRNWGKGGGGPLEFKEPSGIATDRNGHVFILDTWNSAIKTFNLDGKLLKSLNLTKYGYFFGPRRIGWGGDAFLVSNAANNSLSRLAPSGELLSAWNDKKTMAGVSAAINDGKGLYYVGANEGTKSRVQVFDVSGKILRTILTEVEDSDLALDSKGKLFVACYGDPSKVFDPSGNPLGFLVDEDQMEKPLNQIMGIDIAPDDRVVTCGGDTVTIYRMVGAKEI